MSNSAEDSDAVLLDDMGKENLTRSERVHTHAEGKTIRLPNQNFDELYPDKKATRKRRKSTHHHGQPKHLQESNALDFNEHFVDDIEDKIEKRLAGEWDDDLGDGVLCFSQYSIAAQYWRLIKGGFHSPNSQFRRVWNSIIFFWTMYNALVVPGRAVFADSEFNAAAWIWIILDYIGDTFFLMDIIMNFFLRYNSDGALVTNQWRIKKHYLQTWFFIDFIAFVPLDLFFWTNFRTHSALRFNRVFRLSRANQYFSEWEKFTFWPNAIRVAKLVAVVFLITHWVACLYYTIARAEGFPEEAWYLFSGATLRNGSKLENYSRSLYWSFTNMVGLGVDPQSPSNMTQLWFTIFACVMGLFLTTVVVANFWSIIAKLNERSEKLAEVMDQVNSFGLKHNLPPKLVKRMRRYYQHMADKTTDFQSLLENLPTHLRYDVSLYLNRDIIRKVPFFQKCEPAFIKRLTYHLKPLMFSPGEWIIEAGDIGHEMYFISKGEVEVYGKQGECLAHLSSGSFFGEIALLFKCKRTAYIRANTYVDTFVLSKPDLDSTLSEYPKYIPIIQKIAAERLQAAPEVVAQEPNLQNAMGALSGDSARTNTVSMGIANLRMGGNKKLAEDMAWVKGMQDFLSNIDAASFDTLQQVSQALTEAVPLVMQSLSVKAKEDPEPSKKPSRRKVTIVEKPDHSPKAIKSKVTFGGMAERMSALTATLTDNDAPPDYAPPPHEDDK